MKPIKTTIRSWIRVLARGLHKLTRGWVSPQMVTIFGFVMHVPIALLIATGQPIWGAVFLVFFGLFDTLDGELARVQGKESVGGMLLDASTDRMKEVLLYMGTAYWFITTDHPTYAVWAVAACGASLCVSYIKAKGEAAVAAAGKHIPHATLNYLFADGVFMFEVRMLLLVVGLLSGYLMAAVVLIAIGAACTAFARLIRISRQLA